MINRALPMIAAAIVFAFASPSYATFWGNHRGGNQWSNNISNWFNNDWSNNDRRRGGDRDNHKTKKHNWVFNLDLDCDDEGDRWCDDDRDKRRGRQDNRWCDDNWFDFDLKKLDINCDWDWDWEDCDDRKWSWDCDWDWNDCDDREPPRCDNPVPEPATAGLAFMGVGALVAATRRRRK